MKTKYPMLIRPEFRDYLWGGDRLSKLYGFENCPSPAAEAWMIACRDNCDCVIENGPLSGKMLSEAAGGIGKLGLIVKLIDAKSDLSVQVHPDAVCASLFPGDSEKNEIWYIIDCSEDSEIICGIKDGIGKEEAESCIRSGNIEDICRRVKVKKGDIINIEAGTLHAIGKGILLAEVQQDSDTTYRVWDYGRLDKNGKCRELHTEKAITALRHAPKHKDISCEKKKCPKWGIITKIESSFFKITLADIDGESEIMRFDSFRSVVVLEGEGDILCEAENVRLKKGDSVFIPENTDFRIKGKLFLLMSGIKTAL